MESNENCDLPEELVYEILLRLPVKTLLVCKCVCKEWCALIKSPSFVNRHFSRESNHDCLIFRRHYRVGFDDEKYYSYTIYEDDQRHSQVEVSDHLTQMPIDHRILEVLGPENGVFCAVSIGRHIGLFNPAIREFKTLPPRGPCQLQKTSICFEVGFGFDPCSGDFKVVLIDQGLKGRLVFVYNLSSDSWKIIQASEVLDLFSFSCLRYRSIILNGVNYWILKSANPDNSSILSFDFRNEMFQEISIPDALRYTRVYYLRIIEYGDSIAVMSCNHTERVELWVMGRDRLWSKSFIVCPFQGDDHVMLRVWKKNMVFFESSLSALKMFDISTQKVITIMPETPDQDFVCRDHFTYKESLVSIKGARAECVLGYYDQLAP